MHLIHHSTDNDPDEKPQDLLLVSDGSSIEDTTMSYGLVMGLTDGTILLEAMGPACGRPSSHRAECTGCLAGAVILKNLVEFTATSLPTAMELRIMSDNQGMIKSLTHRQTYNISYPNATLESDWELLEEIHTVYSMIKVGMKTFEWIRGHQDTTSDGTQLTIEAEFNIRADHLAGEYSIMVDNNKRNQTPMMSQTKCVFYLNNQAHHGHYTSAIRRSMAEPQFFNYLQQRHNWLPDIIKKLIGRHSAKPHGITTATRFIYSS